MLLYFFFKFKFYHSFIRSLTIDLRNARERLEAYKFIRRLFLLYPQRIPHSFVFVLDAIVSSNPSTSPSRPLISAPIIRSDQMIKLCLELLCEIKKKLFKILIYYMNVMQ